MLEPVALVLTRPILKTFVEDGHLFTPTCISDSRVATCTGAETLRRHLMLAARDPKFSEGVWLRI